MSHPTPRARLCVSIFAIALLFATACGGADAVSTEDGIATLDTGADPAGQPTDQPADDTAEAPADPEAAYELYDECMTDAGFDFLSADGLSGGISIAEEPSLVEVDPQRGTEEFDSFDPDAFDEANSECEKHLDNVDDQFDLSPEQKAEIDDAQLEWTKCMEAQGIEVPDFDDAGSGAIVIESEAVEVDPQTGQPSFDDGDFDFEAFEEAAKECDQIFQDLFPEDGPDAQEGVEG